jgi:hypothetical protein
MDDYGGDWGKMLQDFTQAMNFQNWIGQAKQDYGILPTDLEYSPALAMRLGLWDGPHVGADPTTGRQNYNPVTAANFMNKTPWELFSEAYAAQGRPGFDAALSEDAYYGLPPEILAILNEGGGNAAAVAEAQRQGPGATITGLWEQFAPHVGYEGENWAQDQAVREALANFGLANQGVDLSGWTPEQFQQAWQQYFMPTQTAQAQPPGVQAPAPNQAPAPPGPTDPAPPPTASSTNQSSGQKSGGGLYSQPQQQPAAPQPQPTGQQTMPAQGGPTGAAAPAPAPSGGKPASAASVDPNTYRTAAQNVPQPTPAPAMAGAPNTNVMGRTSGGGGLYGGGGPSYGGGGSGTPGYGGKPA